MVRMFSRKFPSYHPRKGEDTLFVEKILNSLNINWATREYFSALVSWNKDNLAMGKYTVQDLYAFVASLAISETDEKPHTIRAGNRFTPGMKLSPRVWSGKPYNSPQIQFAPDMEVKKVWKFEIENYEKIVRISIDDWPYCEEWGNGCVVERERFIKLANNDGLSVEDFKAWFKWPKEFAGQIICWNENIEY